MTNLDSLLKSRDITLLIKVCVVKDLVFPVVVYIMYGCESWMWEKEDGTLMLSNPWCWRRLFRVPWAVRRLNQSILKEINPEYSFEGLMLKLQYFGHLMQSTSFLEKPLMLEKTEDKTRRGQQRMRWLDSTTDSMHMNLSKLWEIVEARGVWHATVHGVTESDTT